MKQDELSDKPLQQNADERDQDVREGPSWIGSLLGEKGPAQIKERGLNAAEERKNVAAQEKDNADNKADRQAKKQALMQMKRAAQRLSNTRGANDSKSVRSALEKMRESRTAQARKPQQDRERGG